MRGCSAGHAWARRRNAQAAHSRAGTGKTAIAMGIAHELGDDTPFTMIAGSEVRRTVLLLQLPPFPPPPPRAPRRSFRWR